MVLDILIDGVLTALLIGTIGIALVLNSRISALRKEQAEMARWLSELSVATTKAQSSIKQLKITGTAINSELAKNIAESQRLADELGLMTEAGNSLANRLEEKLDGASQIIRALGKDQPIKAKKFKFMGEHGLLSALKDAR